MLPDSSVGCRCFLAAWVKVLCLYCACAMLPAWGAVVVADVDGDGWVAFDANLGVPWTDSLIDVNSDVWGSGEPVSGLGVAFSGPATQDEFGFFDDHIVESSDLAVNLGELDATQIAFSFYWDSLDYSPNAVSVFFRDFQDDDWYRDITLTVAAGWTDYEINLGGFIPWYSPTGGTDFDLALNGGAAQQVGLRLQYGAGVNEEQRYGLANYRVLAGDALNAAVPEPSTTGLLVFGAIFAWVTRRRSLSAGFCRDWPRA